MDKITKIKNIPKDYLDADDLIDSLEKLERANEGEIVNTLKKKEKFIYEIKGGLGAAIKENPRQVKIIKVSPIKKLGRLLKKIFTKF